ncbi:hypothetical protein C8R43DRAFT_1212264 [Mycena crocata]|nr:hypothetical protein C8R43DRAFT_1212264 [Mycena crocata]
MPTIVTTTPCIPLPQTAPVPNRTAAPDWLALGLPLAPPLILLAEGGVEAGAPAVGLPAGDVDAGVEAGDVEAGGVDSGESSEEEAGASSEVDVGSSVGEAPIIVAASVLNIRKRMEYGAPQGSYKLSRALRASKHGAVVINGRAVDPAVIVLAFGLLNDTDLFVVHESREVGVIAVRQRLAGELGFSVDESGPVEVVAVGQVLVVRVRAVVALPEFVVAESEAAADVWLQRTETDVLHTRRGGDGTDS